MSYIGNNPISVSFPTDTFSGTGSQTAFTLQLAPASTNSVIVAVSGVVKDPSTYSVSGTTLTFSAAPPAGTSNISVRFLGVPGIPNTPTAGSVGNASFANNLTAIPLVNGTIGAGNASIMKNRIINGAMVIDQRNAGASITPTNGQYCVDRWQNAVNVSSKYSCQQVADAPAGFTYSLKATSLSAYTIGASEVAGFRQYIEGYNIADLAQGTASAKPFVLSFWVKSSLTGTFGGIVGNDSDRTWAFTYTISAANTWEQKTVAITGQTGGTWAVTNQVGLSVIFSLACGSTYLTTPAQWNSNNSYGATGQGSVLATNGATWQVTGVQLEVGSSATGFEYRQYGTELQLCQRYFEQSYDYGTVAGASTSAGCALSGGPVGGATTGYIEGPAYFKVTKRASPTISNWDLSGNASKCNRTLSGSSSTNNSASATGTIGTNAFSFNSGSSANANIIQIQWTASAEL